MRDDEAGPSQPCRKHFYALPLPSRSVERAGGFNDQSFPQTHEILRLSAARRLEREWQQPLPYS